MRGIVMEFVLKHQWIAVLFLIALILSMGFFKSSTKIGVQHDEGGSAYDSAAIRKATAR